MIALVHAAEAALLIEGLDEVREGLAEAVSEAVSEEAAEG